MSNEEVKNELKAEAAEVKVCEAKAEEEQQKAAKKDEKGIDWKAKCQELEKENEKLIAEAERTEKTLKDTAEEAARARADYYNLRTRVERDHERDVKLAAEKSVSELLPVFENLERIGASMKDKEDNLCKGIAMVTKQFFSAMEKLGLELIPTDGKFDPSVHEAVSLEPVDEKEKDGTIIGALRKGYKLAGRVIRAPQVRVAKYEKEKK